MADNDGTEQQAGLQQPAGLQVNAGSEKHVFKAPAPRQSLLGEGRYRK